MWNSGRAESTKIVNVVDAGIGCSRPSPFLKRKENDTRSNMSKRKPPFDWDALNRDKKAGKAEEAAADRAGKVTAALRELNLQTLAEKDARAEQERLKRIAHGGRPFYKGQNDPPKVVPKGQHDFQPAPFQTYVKICGKCGMLKTAADRHNLPCPDRRLSSS